MAEESCCCKKEEPQEPDHDWGLGSVDTAAGAVARVPTSITPADRIGWWRVRCGIDRATFRVKPGLYAVGEPDRNSEVFVSANYKMSFDHLRRSLDGLNGWIMVLDTKGINVWCAAGKKTFSTEEIVSVIQATKLADVVEHRRVIVPQLGAPGVAAHRVKKESGFKVVYGPVRSADIQAFMDAGKVATPEMREVKFEMADRLALVPMELVGPFKYLAITAVVLFVTSGISDMTYVPERAMYLGVRAVMMIALAWLTAGVIGPALLPVLPGRSFSAKGANAGLLVIGLLWLMGVLMPASGLMPASNLEFGAWALAIPAITSFIVMNFTGSSTYASPSGVRAEMKAFVPLQAAGLILGAVLWVGHLVMFPNTYG